MSTQCKHLCTLILNENFGCVVSKVGEELLNLNPKTFSQLVAATELPQDKVQQALCALTQHNLVTFDAGVSPKVPEYEIHEDRILYILRYPRYLYMVKNLYGDEAEMLVEEILRLGQDTASNTIFRTAKRMSNTLEPSVKNVSLATLRDKFSELAENMFIQRCATVLSYKEKLPTFHDDNKTKYVMCDLDLKQLSDSVEAKATQLREQPDKDIIWQINFQRYHQELRDQIMIETMTRRIDANAGRVMKTLLALMGDSWSSTSSCISFLEIKEHLMKNADIQEKIDAVQYVDQYLKLLVEDSSEFVIRVGENQGGIYCVKMKDAFEQIAWAVVEGIVLEKFGSKAARIFRILKLKKYAEQEQVQEIAMIPGKECKSLCYLLLQQNFVQLKDLRKTAAMTGPNKTFYLFHVDVNMISRMVLEMCYKSFYNAMMRQAHETTENKWIVEKQQRIDSLTLSLKEQGANQEQLEEIDAMLTPPERLVLEKVRATTDKLSLAELKLDETMFQLQMYLFYQMKT